MFSKALTIALSLATVATAWDAPSYSGFNRIWQDPFPGAAGSSPNGNNWEIRRGDLGVNNELQIYTASNQNLQISGGNTLQIVPRRDGSAARGWTSGRVESTYNFTPGAGRVARAEALIRFGDGTSKQGIWPAFWQLGQSIRNGVGWPACGEVDILETVNGILTGYGTVHCGTYPGGICNEPNGIGGSIGIPDQGWHTWRVDYDRRSGNWRDQSITWYMDGRQFHQVTGNRIGDEGVWASLAQSPRFFILNVAVGGDWPGYPNGNTQDGYASMMEIAYVAHYST